MKFPPTYEHTNQIEVLLRDIDILKSAFALIQIPETTLTYMRRTSLLKSSLYSVRIEGNPLREEDVELHAKSRGQSRRKREIANIASALSYLTRHIPKRLSLPFLCLLHRKVMHGLSYAAGYFRSEDSAIYNQAGVVVYIPPRHQDIRQLLEGLIHYTKSTKDPYPVRAAIAHIWFEKIHPFLDGNGRVGRLFSQAILRQGSYGFGSFVPFEEYIDTNRTAYYDFLSHDKQDVTPFVEFFLEAIRSQIQIFQETIKNAPSLETSMLLPRRQEILNIIRDHRMVSFNFLSRWFRRIAKSTLHYDLKQLIRKGHVVKLGTTRGVVYTVKDYNIII